MSSCTYNIESYITSLSMSRKKRILVEGRDDRKHLTNLLERMINGVRIKIDTAQDIRSDDRASSKNNRLKVELIHSRVKGNENILFLCDREFRGFSLDECMNDDINCHYESESLFWTLGHSLENYFFNEEVLVDAYRYLCGSEYKNDAINRFLEVINSVFVIISSLALAARDIGKESFPMSVIKWQDFRFENGSIYLKEDSELDWLENNLNVPLLTGYYNYLPIMQRTPLSINARICRGHSGMILLQRVFSACIYDAGKIDDPEYALDGAKKFSNISEEILANSLSESWVRHVERQLASYPEPLVSKIVA
ncbi:DUF4435 domain-containing protein [Serratia fonticola]|uniref:DUF4435 domain-containing protein n=1 Tax=Serratia fonticola TaxID=47917 RepID=UPI00192B9F55|nr:DUF4435 domain-containing protein [Serratia fonticola]MBL5906020.1 DUF4435 domain-containing protein [Serratia fonticola]